MSHQIERFISKAYRRLVSNETISSILARGYSRKTIWKLNIDPRKNTHYPYVHGDPLQEEVLKGVGKENALTKFKNRDKDIDHRKKQQFVKQRIPELESGLKFEKLAEGDIRLGKTIMKAKSSHLTTANDAILLEGRRLINDALLLGAKPKSIYFCDAAVLKGLPSHLLKDVELYKILYKDMKVWSDAVTPVGILGVFRKPQQGEALSPAETTLPISLILDSMKDPGNVGTLIRTAAAVGCERIITTKGTVNVWDCKVLRSAMGGHFSVPIYAGIHWSDIPNYVGTDAQVYLANTQQSSILAGTFDERLRSEDLDEALIDSNTSDSDREHDSDSDVEENETNDLEAERKAHHFRNLPLPVWDYSDIILSHNSQSSTGERAVHVALVLGAETAGLSDQAKQFAYRYYGRYVSIPMVKTVNSLNTGVAGSIILYELRKKLLAVKS
ncbi:hypothetical protein BsWGS_08551 [Bradybaena similaris]